MPGSSFERMPGIVVQRAKTTLQRSNVTYNTRDGYEQYETNRGSRRRYSVPVEG